MQDVIIADTSCLILLTKINELHLLKSLYGKITITPVIAKEYGSIIPEWITIKTAVSSISQVILTANIDPGEASAINLAMEHPDSLLIIDDLKARRLAKKLNVLYTGTMGILLQAKDQGYVTSIREILVKIRNTNFRISDELEEKVLKLSGESV